MIDNPAQMEHLLARLQTALPLPARLTPEIAARLREQSSASVVPQTCSITLVSYAGDEGGIMCGLDFGSDAKDAAFASITHLRFDPRLPLAREIAAYQKHRVKRLHRAF
ncbi:MAG TPA: hypothetical protein VGG99_14345 [Acetobacteraceae bacterium]|jgi:hypothetical protein